MCSSDLRWWITAAVLPMFGVVAAFGIAPDTLVEKVEVRTVVSQIELRVPSLEDSAQTYVREERIQRGDTVASLLARLHVDDQEAIDFFRQSRGAQSLLQLRPGRTVRATTTGNGSLVALRFLNPSGNIVAIEKSGEAFRDRKSTRLNSSH